VTFVVCNVRAFSSTAMMTPSLLQIPIAKVPLFTCHAQYDFLQAESEYRIGSAHGAVFSQSAAGSQGHRERLFVG